MPQHHDTDTNPPPHPLRTRVEDAFRRRFGADPELLVRAPGRINLLGGHVDHAEGWVLPGAIDRAVWLAVRRAPDRSGATLAAIDLGAEAVLDPSAIPPPVAQRPAPAAGWIDYPRGVAWALTRAGHPPPAIDAVFASDVPIGAGVSSSAAVEVAFLLAWDAFAGNGLDTVTMARLGRQTENAYLGVASGPMDQYASLHGAAGHLLLLDCRHLTHREVPMPAGLAILVIDSGVRRALADSSYNDRPRECAAALAVLRRRLPHAQTLRDVSREELERWSGDLEPVLLRRARHVIEECDRVRRGAEALAAGDLATCGRLIDASHASSRDLFEVSIPELDCLAAAASAAGGCHGARVSGAGFGGCVTALVDEPAAAAVADAVGAAFAERFERRPASFVCAIADGARRWPP